MTLIDVMVAVALLTIGGTGLLAMELSLLSSGEQARLLTDATCRAQERMEQLSYSTAPPVSGGDVVDRYGCSSTRRCVPRGPLYRRTWTVVPGSPSRMQVTVSFPDAAGRQHAVVLDGLR